MKYQLPLAFINQHPGLLFPIKNLLLQPSARRLPALVCLRKAPKKNSRVRETKHLWINADSSTDAIAGWTKNTQKPNFFLKRKKSPKTQKLRNV